MALPGGCAWQGLGPRPLTGGAEKRPPGQSPCRWADGHLRGALAGPLECPWASFQPSLTALQRPGPLSSVRDQETAEPEEENVWLCLRCCCTQYAGLRRAEKSRTGRPGNPDGLTGAGAALSSVRVGFLSLTAKNVLGPNSFPGRACKEIWQSSFQEHQRWQGLPISGCPHLQTDSDQKLGGSLLHTGRRGGAGHLGEEVGAGLAQPGREYRAMAATRPRSSADTGRLLD